MRDVLRQRTELSINSSMLIYVLILQHVVMITHQVCKLNLNIATFRIISLYKGLIIVSHVWCSTHITNASSFK